MRDAIKADATVDIPGLGRDFSSILAFWCRLYLVTTQKQCSICLLVEWGLAWGCWLMEEGSLDGVDKEASCQPPGPTQHCMLLGFVMAALLWRLFPATCLQAGRPGFRLKELQWPCLCAGGACESDSLLSLCESGWWCSDSGSDWSAPDRS